MFRRAYLAVGAQAQELSKTRGKLFPSIHRNGTLQAFLFVLAGRDLCFLEWFAVFKMTQQYRQYINKMVILVLHAEVFCVISLTQMRSA